MPILSPTERKALAGQFVSALQKAGLKFPNGCSFDLEHYPDGLRVTIGGVQIHSVYSELFAKVLNESSTIPITQIHRDERTAYLVLGEIMKHPQRVEEAFKAMSLKAGKILYRK